MQGVPHKVGVYIVDNKPSEKMLRANKNYIKILEKVKELKEKNALPGILVTDGKRSNIRRKTQKGFRIDP